MCFLTGYEKNLKFYTRDMANHWKIWRRIGLTWFVMKVKKTGNDQNCSGMREQPA